ncbi:MAG: cupredoxin domain-containing protein [Candidatus Limnocylindrales bacterium]
MRRRGGWVLVPLLAVLLTACSSGAPAPSPLSPAPAASAATGAGTVAPSVAATVPPPAASASPPPTEAAVPSPAATPAARPTMPPTARPTTPPRPATTPPATGAQAAVSISNFAFVPATITVKVGTRVTWTNRQTGIQHTVTADNGSFGSGDLSTGSSFSYVFTRAGTYAYHCAIHPFMTGRVIVIG